MFPLALLKLPVHVCFWGQRLFLSLLFNYSLPTVWVSAEVDTVFPQMIQRGSRVEAQARQMGLASAFSQCGAQMLSESTCLSLDPCIPSKSHVGMVATYNPGIHKARSREMPGTRWLRTSQLRNSRFSQSPCVNKVESNWGWHLSVWLLHTHMKRNRHTSHPLVEFQMVVERMLNSFSGEEWP